MVAVVMMVVMIRVVVRPAVPFAAVVRQVPVRLLSDPSSSFPSGIRQVFVRFSSGSFWAHWLDSWALNRHLDGALLFLQAWSKLGILFEYRRICSGIGPLNPLTQFGYDPEGSIPYTVRKTGA